MKRFRRFEHPLLVLTLAITAGLFVHFDLLWRWDYLIYDTQLSLWSRPVGDDVVIVEIDDQSLNDIGKWPWPRSIYADLIQEIEPQSPRVIGLDLILSEPDLNNPGSDQRLGDVMMKNGRVMLPVYMTRQSRNGVPIEALPLPEFSRYAAALGHVHVDISRDGIARQVYLWEGIAKPEWMHFSLAMLNLIEPDKVSGQFERADLTDGDYSPMQWSREHPLLIPFAGSTGHFRSIGFSQVLSRQYPEEFFRNKLVLVGATAEGLGDALPTPLSGQSGVMSGVEILANVYDALSNDLSIRELSGFPLVILTLLLVSLPILVYPYVNPSLTLQVMLAVILLTVSTVALLLWLVGWWIPVSTILLFQLLSYPFWSWRRLALAMRHVTRELDYLLDRQSEIRLHQERNLPLEIEFISALIPLSGWVVFDERGRRTAYQGEVPLKPDEQPARDCWQQQDNQCWAWLVDSGRPCLVGLRMKSARPLADQELKLLNNILPVGATERVPQVAYLTDVLLNRMMQVQRVAMDYERLQRIIEDSLSGMADGVIISDSHGQVLFTNRRASWYLRGDDDAVILGRSLLQALQQVQLKDNLQWAPLIEKVMLGGERVVSEGQHRSGRQMMIEISPLHVPDEKLYGLVLNLSDISLLKASERKRNELLSFLSHDLRSPLSSMIAMIELAKNKSSLEDVQAMLDEMAKNTYKTLHIAEQFLQLSRANTHEQLEFHEVDINTIVLNAIDQLWGLSQQSEVSIDYQFEEEEVWTSGEGDLLERAIINLLSNALKHSQAGQQVLVRVRVEDGQIECCVADQGSGIPKQELPLLFEMFKRTRSAQVERKKGSGLGLAFVDAVARRHSGFVEVSSKLGEGSSFCLLLPLVDVG